MICASLVAVSMEEALIKMAAGSRRADILELRIDMISNPDLPALLKDKKAPVLVTNRRREEGGIFRGTEEERIDLLCEAVCLGADYVDIEAATEKVLMTKLLAAVASHGGYTRIIVSHHDFHGVPAESELCRIWNVCRKQGGDIVKVVAFAGQPADNLRILSLIPYSLARGQGIIAFCMGEEGRISRIMAPLLGSYLTFASLDKGEEAAPGQMTVEEIKSCLDLFK